VSLALKATQASAARRVRWDLRGLQDQPVPLVQVHQQRRRVGAATWALNTATSSIRAGLPPGPKGTLIGGNIRQFSARLLDFLLEAAHEYGPLTSFRVGPRRVFWQAHPNPSNEC